MPILEFSRQESTIGYGYLLHFVCRYSQNQLVYSQTNLAVYDVYKYICFWCKYIPAPSKGCSQWFRYRVSIHHPLGFNWHPFEGIYKFISHVYHGLHSPSPFPPPFRRFFTAEASSKLWPTPAPPFRRPKVKRRTTSSRRRKASVSTFRDQVGLGPGGMRSLPTWRIIPVSRWLITMVSKSPKDRVIPLPNGLFMAYKWGLLSTY